MCAAIRVAGHEYGSIGPLLDTGAEGIIVPMVKREAKAKALVRAILFPPRGSLPFRGRRVCDVYGFDHHGQRQPVVIAQIKSVAGLKNAADIIALDGIDILLLDSVDLANDMGLELAGWRISLPRTESILRNLAQMAARPGKAVGCVASGHDALAAAVRCGSRFISAGDDTA